MSATAGSSTRRTRGRGYGWSGWAATTAGLSPAPSARPGQAIAPTRRTMLTGATGDTPTRHIAATKLTTDAELTMDVELTMDAELTIGTGPTGTGRTTATSAVTISPGTGGRSMA